MFLYPWDIIDEGIDTMVARFCEMGIDTVSLALLYHSGTLVLPHNPRKKVLVHPSSRCYFSYTAAAYKRLKPVSSELLTQEASTFVASVCKAFHNIGIRVGAWAVVFHAGRLALTAPDCAIQSCLGDCSAHSLCPSHPEVFDYGLQILTDLAASGVDELHLESVDYGGFLHGAQHEMQAFVDTTTLNRLLGLCFCDSCMARATAQGIDAAQLRLQFVAAAEHFLQMRTDFMPSQDLLCAYETMRANRIAEFYAALHEKLSACGHNLPIRPILWMANGSEPKQSGVDISLLANVVDGVIAVYPDAPNATGAFMQRVRQEIPEQLPVWGGVRLMAPHTTMAQEVGEYLTAYHEQQISDVIFYNYGMTPMPFLQTLMQQGAVCKKM